MFGLDLPRLHAAINDLPAALLVAALLFDLAGWLMKRESLLWAGIWSLWVGVIGGWAAVIVGLLAEKKIDHGTAIHDLMQTHLKLAIIAMSIFTVILAVKLWRRFQLSTIADRVLKVLMLIGVGFLFRTGQLGGRLVFEHAAGIPTATLKTEIQNREGEHEHPGGMTEAHEPGDSAAAADSTKPHVDPPGTPPHEH